MFEFIPHTILFEGNKESKDPHKITRISLTITEYKKLMKSVLTAQQYQSFLCELITAQADIRELYKGKNNPEAIKTNLNAN